MLIEVEDECGGLPPGKADDLFRPFEQRGADRSELGLGLAIARGSVETNGGLIRARSLPDRGCIFTIDLPRVTPASATPAVGQLASQPASVTADRSLPRGQHPDARGSSRPCIPGRSNA